MIFLYYKFSVITNPILSNPVIMKKKRSYMKNSKKNSVVNNNKN